MSDIALEQRKFAVMARALLDWGFTLHRQEPVEVPEKAGKVTVLAGVSRAYESCGLTLVGLLAISEDQPGMILGWPLKETGGEFQDAWESITKSPLWPKWEGRL
jgi:hypothetical protein